MRSLVRLTLLFLLLISIATCKKENQAPNIKSTTANPQSIKTGETTQLTCVASDPDGDQLTYSWSSAKGTFPNGTSGSSVAWLAPDEPENNTTISVMVSDGEEMAQGSVTVSVDANPQLSVTPTELDFGTDDTENTIEIENNGSGSLSWSLSEDVEWLTVDIQSGDVSSGTDQVTLTINREGMDPNSYSTNITISSNGGSQQINIVMEVPEMSGTFIDSRDGHEYKWVKIGEQIWMAENLAYLPSVSPPAEESGTEPYYYVYGYNGTSVSEAKATDNYITYGVLYNWPAAKTNCPPGWHLPTDDEWKQLEMAIGMSQSEADKFGWRGTDEGTKLKATSGWNNNGNGTDDFGFGALPGGFRDISNGNFHGVDYEGDWWSATETAWTRHLLYSASRVRRYSYFYENGFSVRCVKD